jgi:Raf kinase inhibitor-like YbhB/YbcL family protein
MRRNLLSILSSHAGLTLGFVVFLSIAGGCSDAVEPPGSGQSASGQTAHSQGAKKMTFQVTSSAFTQGHPIPKKYTGEGADVSPPLAWSGIPDGTKELVLICDDPDAPNGDWVHWVFYNLPPDTKGLPEGVPRKSKLKEPHGAIQGKNSWPDGENIGYRGPMPPRGHGVHHYYFKLYALDTPITAEPGLNKKALAEKINDHILGEGVLMGTYQR